MGARLARSFEFLGALQLVRLSRSAVATLYEPRCIDSGDIRSRLVRLIPRSPEGSPLERIRHLLAHRFSSTVSEREARDEWRDIIEGKGALWNGIPHDRKEVIRGLLRATHTWLFGLIVVQAF